MTDRESTKIDVQRSFPPLDERHYDMGPQDVAFLKKATGIEDEAALKKHILMIQAKAYEVANS
jgi:hypothetical protein